ncbi:MAG: beta-ketoacyl-ACP synthase III [Gemmatimonadota bacterium]
MTSPGPRTMLRATGRYLPDRVVTNADLEKLVDTSDEWIATRSGIRERRMCAEGEHTAHMAAEAGRQALDGAGVSPADVDVLILSTATPDHLLPATACETQALLGADRAAAFDISAACAGWLYGVALAQGLLAIDGERVVLVIGAEKMSAIIDYTDRSTCVLFGDGAGAGLFGSATSGGSPTGNGGASGGGAGIIATHMQSNGRQSKLLWRPAGGAARPSTDATRSDHLEYVKQEGREIFKHAVFAMEETSRIVLDRAGLTIDDVDLVIPHQANLRIIEAVARRIGAPMSRVYVNIDRYGNTSSASIPIALDEVRRNNIAGPGSTILMTAFGGGLSWGSTLLRL